MKNVIVITGPTATGKSAVAAELASRLGSGVISADSMQVYKHMNIGTAKPEASEVKGIKHYLIDEIMPNDNFSVADFMKLAGKYLSFIADSGKIPVVAGGTGLYVSSLISDADFAGNAGNSDLRKRLGEYAELYGNDELHKKLELLDPEVARKIHKNDIKRIIRAIEIFEQTKKTRAEYSITLTKEPPQYNFILIGLTCDRKLLYERINRRVDKMLAAGLVDEVKKLVSMGCRESSVSMQGLGYKEILWYLRGKETFEESVEQIKRNTRRFAKRQMTWFRRMEDIYWIDIGASGEMPEIIKNIAAYIATSGIIL